MVFGAVKLQSPDGRYQSQIIPVQQIQKQLLQSESPDLDPPDNGKVVTSSKSKEKSVVFKDSIAKEILKVPESLLQSVEQTSLPRLLSEENDK